MGGAGIVQLERNLGVLMKGVTDLEKHRPIVILNAIPEEF